MARHMNRFHLYAVFIILLSVITTATALMLNTLLQFTPLNPNNYRPDHASVIQSLVLGLTSLVIAGALAGLYYWLIRRDMRDDPNAGSSAIRAFFLNFTEAISMLIFVPVVGFGVISSYAYGNNNSVSSLSIALPVLALVLFIEQERRRAVVRQGAAVVFQRIHFFGVQWAFLGLMAGTILTDLHPLLNTLYIGHPPICNEGSSSYYCGGPQNLWYLTATMAWFIAAWLLYALATSKDNSRVSRLIFHGISLAIGMGYILWGIAVAVKLFLLPLYKVNIGMLDVFGTSAQYDFITPLLLGGVVVLVYHLLMRALTSQNLLDASTRRLTEQAIVGIVLAGAFWWGLGSLIYGLLQALPPTNAAPEAPAWTFAIGLVIAGLAYIPLDVYLKRQLVRQPANAMGPRRGFVLALLAAGLLTLATGGIASIYNGLTMLLNSATGDAQMTLHAGLATAIVGAIVTGLYFWFGRREQLLTRRASQPVPVAPVTPVQPAATIESILDDLLAGRITRDEAAARIRTVSTQHGTLVFSR